MSYSLGNRGLSPLLLNLFLGILCCSGLISLKYRKITEYLTVIICSLILLFIKILIECVSCTGAVLCGGDKLVGRTYPPLLFLSQWGIRCMQSEESEFESDLVSEVRKGFLEKYYGTNGVCHSCEIK